MSGRRADSAITVVILAGGQGTRLREIDPARPKPMVLVSGRPFLHWLVAHLHGLGFRRFILSTCHLAGVVEEHPWAREFPDASFEFARERSPLGTGGAVQAIFRDLRKAWVINGDTLLPELPEALPEGAEAVYVALAPGKIFDATPNLRVEGERVVEGGVSAGNYFDAGAVFVTDSAVGRYHGRVPCSVHELLAPAMSAGRVSCVVASGTCYDIGTPERLKRFEAYLKGN